MAEEPDDSIQRWTAKRRAALIVSLLKGETSVAEAAREMVEMASDSTNCTFLCCWSGG
jgi:hypothetical protein